MRHQIPIEVRQATGKRKRNDLALIPDGLRTPALKDMANFNKMQYREEVDAFLRGVYGMRGHEMTVALLAEEMDVYCAACAGRATDGGKVVSINGTVSAYVKVQQSALKGVLSLVRELGLTPSSRLKAPEEKPVDEALARFLAFPNSIKTEHDKPPALESSRGLINHEEHQK